MKILITLICTVIFLAPAFPQNKDSSALYKQSLRFDFGSKKVKSGYLQVLPQGHNEETLGYQLIGTSSLKSVKRKGGNPLSNSYITSKSPFYFHVKLPEGNYKVTVHLGDIKGESVTTVKAESRRLMIEKAVDFQKVGTYSFIVNVRKPEINTGGSIKLKPRELNYLNWDDKLTLEFSNKKPCVAGIEIERSEDVITLFLAGNSTVVDQEYEPYAAWGQMITGFLKPEVVVANFAESGESLRSFVSEKRLEKVMSIIKPGDYLLIEFGHNDQKQKGENIGAYTSYTDHLKLFIRESRNKGANPVLITPINRKRFDENGAIINTLEDYPDAVRKVALEDDVPLIDLNAMSKTLFESMGPEASKKAFLHVPAGTYPNQQEKIEDDTHFSTYGAYQLAKCVIEGIKMNNLMIAEHIKDDYISFDPKKPDSYDSWDLSISPGINLNKPDGN